jgi:hypothetical protein
MVTAETNPTPKPAIRRPTDKAAMLSDATWTMTPTMKTRQPAMIVVFRPIQSASTPLRSAPKKVPAERIETIKLCCDVLMTYRKAPGSFARWPYTFRNSVIPSTPLI